MGKYFVQGTPLAELEREMMTPPYFIHGRAHAARRRGAVQLARRTGGFRFADPLQPRRILEKLGQEEESMDSGWLAAVYLSASAGLWQRAGRVMG